MTAPLPAVAALAAAALLAQATPQQELLRSLGLPDAPGRAVVDTARVLSPATRSALEELLGQHQAQSSNQVVVVTLPSLQGADIADVGYALGQTWRVGQAGRDNGVVLLIAVQERRSRIDVGKGLEGALTDLESRIILDEVVRPFLAQGRYDEGLFRGAQAVLRAVEGEFQGTGQRGRQQVQVPGWVVLLGIGLLVLLFFVWPEAGMLVLWTLASGGRGGGGRGGGGFSGGGGRFGGGGASGDW